MNYQYYIPPENISIPQSKKVVLVGGCFDIIHFGHIQFLEKAKEERFFMKHFIIVTAAILSINSLSAMEKHTSQYFHSKSDVINEGKPIQRIVTFKPGKPLKKLIDNKDIKEYGLIAEEIEAVNSTNKK